MEVFALLETLFTQYGYIAVFVVLILCGMGIPIPEDITLITGGVVAGLGYANVHTMVIVGFLGVMVGDGLMFAAGKIFGHRILRFRPIARIMTPRRYTQVQEQFDRYGNGVLFIARFLPGLRMPIYISAGISKKISYFRFFMMDGLAASLSVPIWVYLGNYSAENIDWLMTKVHQFQILVIIAMMMGAALIAFWWYRRRTRIQFFRDRRKQILARRHKQQQNS